MAIEKVEVRAGPPLGRHIAALALTVGLTASLFWVLGGGLPVTHAVFADVSLVLLCLILMLGAGARVIPRLRPVVPWGRELGIAMFITAMLHVFIIAGPNVIGWFGELFFSGIDRSNRMWVLAAWLGIGALAYATALAATSNDWSQRFLGRGWKFLQRQAYTLFVLTWLHTAAYLFFRAGHEAQLPLLLFWGATGAAVVTQLIGFVHTVRSRRAPSQHRVPAKKSTAGRSSGLSRWAAVTVMWGIFVLGSWTLAYDFGPSEEEEMKASAFCQRYEEIADLDLDRDRLVEELASLPFPNGDEAGTTFGEALEMCQ